MTKLVTVFAVAFATVALIASTTFGRVEQQPAAEAASRISPMQMMTGQHLQRTEMTDMSLVYER